MLKKVAAYFGVFLAIVLITLFFLPTLLSTSFGKKKIAEIVFKKTGFQLQIDDLSLSWLGAQTARGVKAQNTDDKIFIYCPEISTEASLLQLIFKKDWKQILVKQGEVEFAPPNVEPIRFKKIDMALDMKNQDEVALKLHGESSSQGGSGEIAIKASASEIHSPFPKLSLAASITELPVLGIDQLVSIFQPRLNGLIYAAVGPKIDIQCQLTANKGDFAISFNANSPQMNAQVVAQTENDLISLKSPATWNMTLTPAFVQKWANFSPSLSGLALSQPAFIQGTLSQFSCPIPATGEDLLKSAFQAKIVAEKPLLFSINTTAFPLSNLNLTVGSKSLQDEIVLALSTGAQAGSLAVAGNIAHPLSASPIGSLTMDAVGLPVDLVGLISGASTPLSPLLGPTVNLKGGIDFTEKGQKLHLSWQSQFLNLPSLDLSLGSTIALLSPASFTAQLNPVEFQLIKADPIEGTLQSLAIPKNQIQNMSLDAVLSSGQILVSSPLPIQITKLQASLLVKTLDQISLNIKGEQFQAALSGAFRPKTSEFVLNKPLSVQYAIGSALIPNLAKPAIFQLVIDPFSIPLAGIDWRGMPFKGKFSSPEIALRAQDQIITLQNTALPFQWNPRSKTANLQLSSSLQNPTGSTGSMQGEFTLSGFSVEKQIDFNQASVLGTLDLQNISSALFDTLYPKIPLSTLAGPYFSSKFKLQSTSDKQNIALKWTSSLLNIDTAFVVDSSSVRLQGTTNQLSWILTPESYALLDSATTGFKNTKVPFELSGPSTFAISLSKLFLPVLPKQGPNTRIPQGPFDLSKLQMSGTARNSNLSFFDKSSKETIQLSNLTLNVNKAGDLEPLTVSLETGVTTLTGSKAAPGPIKNGSLSLAAALMQPVGSNNFNLQVKAEQFPSKALDIIARARGRTDSPFTTLFGEMINTSIAAEIKNASGPVAFNLNTPRARLDLKGHFASGAMMLDDTFYAQMKVTPELSRLVLKEVNPLNLSYFYSEAPITLEIPSKGFYLPLSPTDLSKITIPEAKIELGKVACRNEGNVNITLGLLKSKQAGRNGELSLWFAPIDLSVKKGIVDIERTEILLADAFDICVWGTFDLVKDYVDMILGLTAQTLSKAFGVKNLPENYVLTLPMKGPSNNVQINTSKATAKVALLLAWQNKNLTGAFGGAGAIVGDVLGRIATLPDSNAKVPPAKHPFPWEVSRGRKTSEAPKEKKKQFKANEKPLKQILKVIK